MPLVVLDSCHAHDDGTPCLSLANGHITCSQTLAHGIFSFKTRVIEHQVTGVPTEQSAPVKGQMASRFPVRHLIRDRPARVALTFFSACSIPTAVIAPSGVQRPETAKDFGCCVASRLVTSTESPHTESNKISTLMTLSRFSDSTHSRLPLQIARLLISFQPLLLELVRVRKVSSGHPLDYILSVFWNITQAGSLSTSPPVPHSERLRRGV
jgi:hypothetical protein